MTVDPARSDVNTDADPAATGPSTPDRPATGLMAELAEFGRAFKQLFGAQLHLLATELGVARAAVSWILLAGLAAMVAGVGLGLSLLALIGVVLAKWFGSWLWALAALCVLQALFLLGSLLLFRRCMHWMSLPVTRNEWGAMVRETREQAKRQIATAPEATEESP